jgi:putative endonuclease
MAYYVYLLASRKDGPLYLGVTNDLIRRIYEHRTKAVRSFTSRYNITRLCGSKSMTVPFPPFPARKS